MKDEYLDLIIRDREKIIFDGKVKSVSSFNEKGRFDVLPQHANFISIINRQVMYTNLANEEKGLGVTTGIIKVDANKANVFLGIGG